MSSILSQILAHKRTWVNQQSFPDAREALALSTNYPHLLSKNLYLDKSKGKKTFICEFKRKSPSDENINLEADLSTVIEQYKSAGASAVSILTEEKYFGGSLEDLRQGAELLEGWGIAVLQKDFVVDKRQLYLAKQYGAHVVLLIVAALTDEELVTYNKVAKTYGLDVLCEVHSVEEYERVAGMGFKIIGVNNRDLKTFHIALNAVNVVAKNSQEGSYLIAESGISTPLDFRVAGMSADGFLIGTSLMKRPLTDGETLEQRFGLNRRFFFKACGIRGQVKALVDTCADLYGFNFSAVSKRRVTASDCEHIPNDGRAVAVFYQNPKQEVQTILARYPFRYVQLYETFGRDLDFLTGLKKRIIFAVKWGDEASMTEAMWVAPYVDFFIIDSTSPGSGQMVSSEVNFGYPFLLAGGINDQNLDRILKLSNCIGVDVASGIEVDGSPNRDLINQIALRLNNFT